MTAAQVLPHPMGDSSSLVLDECPQELRPVLQTAPSWSSGKTGHCLLNGDSKKYEIPRGFGTFVRNAQAKLVKNNGGVYYFS